MPENHPFAYALLTRDERSTLNRLAYDLSQQAFLAYKSNLIKVGINQKLTHGHIDQAAISAAVHSITDTLGDL
ncbi:MAG: hypothetical protein Q8S73_21395 [Deltaproteobacteria bacterium]|nr:hypothetical protein [Deltaproteobacteria bacterium]